MKQTKILTNTLMSYRAIPFVAIIPYNFTLKIKRIKIEQLVNDTNFNNN